ncbi:hypothetical protein WUBG_04805 [Wuchereria bancrofti]|uniref:Uncharacterized protein n=1 Tax=Wuchereria bancrofti TaxID=6293 RepID=J9EP35_WUCBA|nr:hypothetical protein WUBG_04805 [Wuchereria bancrofti]
MAEGRAHCRGKGHVLPSAAVTFSNFRNDEETDLLLSRTGISQEFIVTYIAAFTNITYRFSSSSLDFVLKMPYTSEQQHILATIYILTTNAFVLFANEIIGEPFIREFAKKCTLAQLYSFSLGFFCSFALRRFMTRYPFHCSYAIPIFNSTTHLSTQNLFNVMIK